MTAQIFFSLIFAFWVDDWMIWASNVTRGPLLDPVCESPAQWGEHPHWMSEAEEEAVLEVRLLTSDLTP